MGCMFKNHLFISRTSFDEIFITGCCLTEQIKVDDFFKQDLNYLSDLRKGLPQVKGSTCLQKPCNYGPVKAISINILHKCNLKCYHCVSSFENPYIKNARLMLAKTFAWLKKIKGLEKIELDSSGEIFLEYDLLKKLLKTFSTENTKTIVFTTNGMLLNEKIIKELKEISEKTHINYCFLVSVDGITKQTYEAVRIGGNFEKVIENICLLKKYFNVAIQFCIKKPNCRDTINVKKFFKDLGFEDIFINADYFDPEMTKYIDQADLVYNKDYNNDL